MKKFSSQLLALVFIGFLNGCLMHGVLSQDVSFEPKASASVVPPIENIADSTPDFDYDDHLPSKKDIVSQDQFVTLIFVPKISKLSLDSFNPPQARAPPATC